MLLDASACYAALRTRDARFDGRFFVGVSSTGIYCRPVCRVKLPRSENCSFFVSAAAAEAAGYRPCLRCRPELAPGLAPVDASAGLARNAARMMAEEGEEGGVSALAGRLGISDRHLRRVFAAEYGVAPVRYLQTQRLLLAKSLLTDTLLPVTAVAMYAGFGSIRRFNDLFREHYRLTPSCLRRQSGGLPPEHDRVTLYVSYRPPYNWEALLTFLAARAIPGVEEVADGVYRRTAAVRQNGTLHTGWVEAACRPERQALAVTVAASLLPALPAVLTRVRHLFDTDCQPDAISCMLSVMNELSPGLFMPGIRLPGCFDPFEMAVRAVLGQQITVKAARTLAQRIAAAFGENLVTPFPGLTRIFPGPDRICALGPDIAASLGPLGVTGARSRSILALADALTAGSVTLAPYADAERETAVLQTLPGFGPWTAQYVAMRALAWPDAFLPTDYGVKKVLGGRPPRELLELSQKWSPWRSYATVSLWQSLAAPAEKVPPAAAKEELGR